MLGGVACLVRVLASSIRGTAVSHNNISLFKKKYISFLYHRLTLSAVTL